MIVRRFELRHETSGAVIAFALLSLALHAGLGAIVRGTAPTRRPPSLVWVDVDALDGATEDEPASGAADERVRDTDAAGEALRPVADARPGEPVAPAPPAPAPAPPPAPAPAPSAVQAAAPPKSPATGAPTSLASAQAPPQSTGAPTSSAAPQSGPGSSTSASPGDGGEGGGAIDRSPHGVARFVKFLATYAESAGDWEGLPDGPMAPIVLTLTLDEAGKLQRPSAIEGAPVGQLERAIRATELAPELRVRLRFPGKNRVAKIRLTPTLGRTVVQKDALMLQFSFDENEGRGTCRVIQKTGRTLSFAVETLSLE